MDTKAKHGWLISILLLGAGTAASAACIDLFLQRSSELPDPRAGTYKPLVNYGQVDESLDAWRDLPRSRATLQQMVEHRDQILKELELPDGFVREIHESILDDTGTRHGGIYRITGSDRAEYALKIVTRDHSVIADGLVIQAFLGEEGHCPKLKGVYRKITEDKEVLTFVVMEYFPQIYNLSKSDILKKRPPPPEDIETWDFITLSKGIYQLRDLLGKYDINPEDVQIGITKKGKPILLDLDEYKLNNGFANPEVMKGEMNAPIIRLMQALQLWKPDFTPPAPKMRDLFTAEELREMGVDEKGIFDFEVLEHLRGREEEEWGEEWGEN